MILSPQTSLTKKQRKQFVAFLFLLCLACYSNSIRERKFLLRQSILPPNLAPWNHLMYRGDASSFLLLTGLTQEAFIQLHDLLKPPGHPDLPPRKGRRWSLPSHAHLGLMLFYLGSTMPYKHLCLIFGITPSVCSRILCNMLRLMVRCLREHPSAGIKFPSPEKMQQFAMMVNRREPSIVYVMVHGRCFLHIRMHQ